MKIEEYYDDFEPIEVMKEAIELHERVKQQMSIDDLVSVVVCQLLHTDNHRKVEAKINSIEI